MLRFPGGIVYTSQAWNYDRIMEVMRHTAMEYGKCVCLAVNHISRNLDADFLWKYRTGGLLFNVTFSQGLQSGSR